MEFGKISTDINYNFLIESNDFAIASAILKVQKHYSSADSTYLKIKEFNTTADKMYKNLQKDTQVMVAGNLLTDGFIEVKNLS